MNCDFNVNDWISQQIIRKHGIDIPRDVFNKVVAGYEKLIDNEFYLLQIRMKTFLRPKDKQGTIEKVCGPVVDIFDVPFERIIANTRKVEYTMPRHLIRYLLYNGYGGRVFTLFQVSQITTHNRRKDHALVLNSIKVIKNMIETDKVFKSKVDRVIEIINSDE